MDTSDGSAGNDPLAASFNDLGTESDTGQGWEMDRSLVGQFLARSPVGMAVMSPELRYIWINDALERLGGVPREERLGKRLGDVLPKLDAEAIEATMRRVLETGEPAVDIEYRGRTQADPEREHAYSTSFFRLDDTLGRVRGVCYMVIDVTDRWRAGSRLALLNEVGARTGKSLNLIHIAQALADSCVPHLADFVAVDLLDPVLLGEAPRPGPVPGTQQLRRAGLRSAGPDLREPIAETGQSVVFPPSSPGERCLLDGSSYLRPVLDDEAGGWLAAEPHRAEDNRGLGRCSLMLVRVGARGNALGVATFIRRESRGAFEQADLLLAEDLVARAAVNIDNARQFTREHNTALALQRFLLPQRVTTQSSLEVESRYLPAEASDGVGGDWFDVIRLSGARVALVVGDVVGHGIRAAASMGRLRTAVRTLADLDLPPEELLAHLDDQLLGLIGEDVAHHESPASAVLGATCLYAVYDPASRRCTMARAGHPPPALVSPDGSVAFLDLPPGPPLGLGGLPFESADFEVAEGSVLALYTNGLIEARERDVEVGMSQLGTALASPGMPLDELCASVLTHMLKGPPDDDVALLLARTHALGSDQVASWDLPSDPAVVAEARARTLRCLDAWGLGELGFTMELIVSELVTNAIRYASGPIRLRLIRQDVLICEVFDTSNTSPRLRHARTTDEGGRGLFLVAQVAKRWGTRYTAEGKIIWAEHDPSEAPVM
ncbi:SpoIIE family protein phosphatase [Streptomyces sp.]|uniref:SpoIIE family protein phosphatase n=1 Tax=Streptomyces sp. TaxID=1931 RepID=UPI002D78453E|nr:SpoIIE family protein phosphatase [Streptomyces sp.]HET6358937.1 SpoIIE family protein phosphatase [Streptomyces sp.]